MLSRTFTATTLPAHNRLHGYVQTDDFLDCDGVPSDLDAHTAAEVAADKLGLFPVEHSDAHEVVVGFNDSHLEFRISVMAHEGQVTLATWVHTHNFGGKVYLAAIMPFHILISRNALARVEQAAMPQAA